MLNVLSFGAGAIGTYIGGSLALSGQRVTFLERPDVAAELRRGGLHLGLPTGEAQIPQPEVCGSLDEALRHLPGQRESVLALPLQCQSSANLPVCTPRQ